MMKKMLELFTGIGWALYIGLFWVAAEIIRGAIA